MKNPYFIEDNGGLSQSQVSMMKKNNFYLYRALSHLYRTVNSNNSNTKIGGPYRTALISGELPKNDNVTGIDTNNLAAKLKFLVLALSDNNHPEYKEAFKNSFLYSNILETLCYGYTTDSDLAWKYYTQTDDVEDSFKNKSSYDAALVCQRDDPKSPLGLDFSKLIDSFVKTDKNGNFYLENDYNVDEELAMTDAVKTQLETLKNNSRFCDNYNNANINKDTSDDFEDEL